MVLLSQTELQPEYIAKTNNCTRLDRDCNLSNQDSSSGACKYSALLWIQGQGISCMVDCVRPHQFVFK